ncbi:hypothetical protein YB2330_002312 [Saitoella coloradoensis]
MSATRSWALLPLAYHFTFRRLLHLPIDNVGIFLLTVISLAIYSIFIYPNFISPLRKVPGPPGHWFWGHFQEITKADPGVPHLEWAAKYGKTIRYRWLFGDQRFLTVDPKSLAYILNNAYDFPKPQQTIRFLGRFLGFGLLTAEGELHKRQRKVLQPAFAHAHVKALVPEFWKKTEEVVDCWNKEINAAERPEEGVVVEVLSWLSRTTLDIIGTAGFGYDFDALHTTSNPLAEAYKLMFKFDKIGRVVGILSVYLPFLRSLPFKRNRELKSAVATVNKISEGLVHDRISESKAATETSTKGKDILSLIVEEALRAEREGESSITPDEMKDQCMTFLAAGHETTSTSTTWACWLLASHPDVQSRLRTEIQSIIPEEGGAPTYEQIEGCRYLNNVCREILRHIPPVPFTFRVSTKDEIIDDYFVPAGTHITIPQAAMCHAPHLWGPTAHLFDPDRWDNLPETASAIAYLPFLAGPRSCIGRKFAEVEMKALIVGIVGRFELEKSKGDQKVELKSNITTRPVGGMPLRVKRV